MLLPGLFFHLERDGTVTAEALAPLLSRLPPESFVRTEARGGEAFDSVRWPVARDAALASLAARRLGEPTLAAAQAEIDAAAGDPARLRALARAASARVFATAGADLEMFQRLWHDAGAEEAAIFAAPPWPFEAARRVESLCHVHHHAADGLYAYHAYRGLHGPGAEPAAILVRTAIAMGRLTVDELVSAACALVDGRAA